LPLVVYHNLSPNMLEDYQLMYFVNTLGVLIFALIVVYHYVIVHEKPGHSTSGGKS